MKSFLAFAIIYSSFNLFAEEPKDFPAYPGGMGMVGIGMGPAYGMKFDPCVAQLNMSLVGYGYGLQQSPISIDAAGKLAIDHKKIKSFKESGNTKIIVFEMPNPYGEGKTVRKIEVEEEAGKIVRIARYEDLDFARKAEKQLKKMGSSFTLPLLKSTDMSFKHQTSGCQMTNSEMTVETNGKESIKVTYDKKLCDSIMPFVNQMGRQNALQCGNLFTQIEEQHKSRSKEILKDGKDLAMSGFANLSEKGPDDKYHNWSTMNVISNCMMVEMPVSPGIGLGMVGGFWGGGYGFPGTVASPAMDKKSIQR